MSRLTAFLALASLLFTSTTAIPFPYRPASDSATSCTSGSIICGPDGMTWSMCSNGKPVEMGSVAAGTKCQDGQIIRAEASLDGGGNGGGGGGGGGDGEGGRRVVTTIQPGPENPGANPSGPTNPVPTSGDEDYNEPEPTGDDDADGPTPTGTQGGGGGPVPPAPTGGSTSAPAGSPVDMTSSSASSRRTKFITVWVGTGSSAVPSSTAAPTNGASGPSTGKEITPAMISVIAPETGSCTTAGGECGTADEAATNMNKAFAKYSITELGERRAVLALTAFESVGFKFSTNQKPRAGQGTKAMLMPDWVLEYVKVLDPAALEKIETGLSTKARKDFYDSGNVEASDAQESDASVKEKRNAVRAIAIATPETNYAASSWFYSTQCTDAVKTGLKGSTEFEAFKTFLLQCIGVGDKATGEIGDIEGRKAFWDRTVAQLTA